MTTHSMDCLVCSTPARLWQHDRKEVIDFGFGDREETIRHTYRMGCRMLTWRRTYTQIRRMPLSHGVLLSER